MGRSLVPLRAPPPDFYLFIVCVCMWLCVRALLSQTSSSPHLHVMCPESLQVGNLFIPV